MFEKIIRYSLEHKFLILLGVLALVIIGIYSATKIPLDAVPDITNNQVQIVSTSPTLAPQEVEQLITYPLESAMTNIPDVTEVRSISRYGLSVITIVFEDHVPILTARQYVQEQLNVAKSALPMGLTEPELMPITTGLGEIYQYVLTVEPKYAHLYDATQLRTIQDWIVKRQLNGTPGIIEVSSFGGYIKQYEVALKPSLIRAHGLSIPDVVHALETSNQNSGGSYIESGPYSFYIRTQGRITSIEAIKQILIKNKNGTPIIVDDIADVRIGSPKRYGAMTMDGKGEVVGGITLMLKGANSSEVLAAVTERVSKIEQSLPEGVSIYPYLDRSKLIGKTISTARTNLIEGGLIVILVLMLLLGNLRAGLIVASVIPLSMLFALIMMRFTGISANLMSLGAIDFGIVIDGAVIIVESLLHTLTLGYLGKKLSKQKMDEVVQESSSNIYKAAAFGVLIILVVFIPILTLDGIEGKTFRPMAQTVAFAILGSLILSLTYVPVMSSLMLSRKIKREVPWSRAIMKFFTMLYRPFLRWSLRWPAAVIISSLAILLFSFLVFDRLGAEFVPTLEEGDIAMQQSIKPGSSLQESIRTAGMAERILLDNFPEIDHVVSKIGTAEVPTDPMAIEDADVMIIMKDKSEWRSANNREDMMAKMKAKLEPITWAAYEFTQPIQLRFNELMTGSKSDVSVKIFGEDVETLKAQADLAAERILNIQGAGDVKVDQTEGLQQLTVQMMPERLAQFGVHVEDVNQVIRAAYAGEVVGDIYEQERKFDLVVRLTPEYRRTLDLDHLTVPSVHGHSVTLSEVAYVEDIEGPMMISREQARRFINIGVNVRNRDVASLVDAIQTDLDENLDLPPGYEIQYGGQFENLQHARQRLLIAVPLALLLIVVLLYFAFGNIVDTLIVFMAVPLSAVGGILALAIRGMPFSISSGIGFIELFGVSVLNGIVLLSAIRQLDPADFVEFRQLINTACLSRLRPVLMTAFVAALGFLPMAISTGNGAEVQRPLATVVIGGLVTSTLLTLVFLPTLYYLINKRNWNKALLTAVILLFISIGPIQAQNLGSYEEIVSYSADNHPLLKDADLQINSKALDGEVLVPWGPFSVDYQGGEINYNGYDQFITLNQDISPLFRGAVRRERRNLVDAEISMLDAQRLLVFNELAFDIKEAYNQWQYLQSKSNYYDSIAAVYNGMAQVITARFEAGSIDAVSRSLFIQEQVRLEQEILRLNSEVDAAEWEVRRRGFIPDTISISAQPLERIDAKIPEMDTSENIFLNQYRRRQAVLVARKTLVDLENRQADWNLGYFAQSLEDEWYFHGISFGVQVPIDQRRSKVQQNQMQIEVQRQEVQLQAQVLALAAEYKSLKLKLEGLAASMEMYEDSMTNALSDLIETAAKQYNAGTLSFFEFNLMQREVLNSRLSFLSMIREYNETYLKILYLTQSN